MWVQYSPTEYMTYVAVSTAVLLYYCQYCTTQYCTTVLQQYCNSIAQLSIAQQYCNSITTVLRNTVLYNPGVLSTQSCQSSVGPIDCN